MVNKHGRRALLWDFFRVGSVYAQSHRMIKALTTLRSRNILGEW
jgi:hypothetical protein